MTDKPIVLLPNAFRDTALTVATLADNATSTTFADFRKDCLEQVDALRRELTAAGHPSDVVADATYAQCALLDETALIRLKDHERDAWEREPLPVQEFNTNDAGDELIARIHRRLQEPAPKLVLLSIFNAVLGLGFTGKFALNGADARIDLMRALDQRTGQSQDTSGTVLLSSSANARWRMSISPLGYVVGGIIVAALVYLALDRWLAASIARLPG
ncbi:DotU family type IV / VI secretion system protein [Burkholderia sp. Leaf177]|uniref:DotU/TssL family secretion system protein n=1 Tax=Burkholderia sp. Leaf177 TaxID=1736287 RepID=UPI0006F5151F|nr:DotU/TssL family secretion system protein [Burkholderia sp. Leaf177]KQR78923.1 DotU family type IV / VI secretion system protein [Burkholderia sp. Leaf177]